MTEYRSGCSPNRLVGLLDRTRETVIPGRASIVVPIAFVGGLQLASPGFTGESIGRISVEVKRRPLFEIEEFD